MADPYETFGPSPLSFGTVGAAVTPDDDTDLDPIAKSVLVTSVSGGAVLEVLPAGNANEDMITISDVSVGYMPPYRIRRVGEATTCTVYTVGG